MSDNTQTSGEVFADLDTYSQIRQCRVCAIRDECRRPVPGEGPLNARIAFIGQNPGDREDTTGRPFVGHAGEEFDHWLLQMRLKRSRVYVTNICKCHTTRNRAPLKTEAAICRNQWLPQELAALSQLQILMPLGKVAIEAILPLKKIPSGIDTYWVTVQWGQRTFTVLPLPHPAFILRMPHQREPLYNSTLPVVVAYLRKYAPEAYDASTF